LNAVVDEVIHDLEDVLIGATVEKRSLRIPVRSTCDGSLLQGNVSELLQELTRLQLCKPVDWVSVCYGISSSYVVEIAGVGKITSVNLEGSDSKLFSFIGEQVETSELFSQSVISKCQSWRRQFYPVPLYKEGSIIISTKFTRSFNRPPIMVPGMTPSTAGASFVAAVCNAGYHCELAGGGQHFEKMFRDQVLNIMQLMNSPGDGITVNLLFLNPYLWKFQFPMCIEMRREGLPIEAITIAAGIPSLDNANDIINQCISVGIKKIGFKPGTVNAINEVIVIAKANPSATIVLQWTGGQSGGHHSFENQFVPMLEAYGAIRECDNIILIAGGGIGDAKGVLVSHR